MGKRAYLDLPGWMWYVLFIGLVSGITALSDAVGTFNKFLTIDWFNLVYGTMLTIIPVCVFFTIQSEKDEHIQKLIDTVKVLEEKSQRLDLLESEWINPNSENLKLTGYKFYRCLWNYGDLMYRLFLEKGGNRELFLKYFDFGYDNLLIEDKNKLLAVIGGFPDIPDWYKLNIENRIGFLKIRLQDLPDEPNTIQ